MEIIYKDKKKVAFEMVAIGDVFYWSGELYMSIQEVASTSTGEVFNAVNLANGEAAYFDENDAVIPVKAQLVIS